MNPEQARISLKRRASDTANPVGEPAMQIDYDYLKRLMEAFTEAPRPTTDIVELQKLGLDYETDIFVFHMQILQDQGFIVQPDGDTDIGLQYGIGADEPSWGAVPLRLTAAGHEFLDGLRSKQAMAVIKSSAKSVSISTAKAIFKAVLEESTKAAAKAFLSAQ